MKDVLRSLVRLQELMRAAEEENAKIAAVPAAVARLEKDLLAAQEEVERERVRLDDLQKDRRKLESELMGVESKIEKYQAQLSEVKTNKEYQAMLKEIESCKEERAALDEKILVEMEASEEHRTAFRGTEEGLEARRRETEAGKKRLADELEGMKRGVASLEEERERLAESIPAAYLEPFMKIARMRHGIALVPVVDELCGGCHVRVMPTLIQQVRRATGLIACDSCKRYMYVPEDLVPPPPPGADSPAP